MTGTWNAGLEKEKAEILAIAWIENLNLKNLPQTLHKPNTTDTTASVEME